MAAPLTAQEKQSLASRVTASNGGVGIRGSFMMGKDPLEEKRRNQALKDRLAAFLGTGGQPQGQMQPMAQTESAAPAARLSGSTGTGDITGEPPGEGLRNEIVQQGQTVQTLDQAVQEANAKAEAMQQMADMAQGGVEQLAQKPKEQQKRQKARAQQFKPSKIQKWKQKIEKQQEQKAQIVDSLIQGASYGGFAVPPERRHEWVPFGWIKPDTSQAIQNYAGMVPRGWYVEGMDENQLNMLYHMIDPQYQERFMIRMQGGAEERLTAPGRSGGGM